MPKIRRANPKQEGVCRTSDAPTDAKSKAGKRILRRPASYTKNTRSGYAKVRNKNKLSGMKKFKADSWASSCARLCDVGEELTSTVFSIVEDNLKQLIPQADGALSA